MKAKPSLALVLLALAAVFSFGLVACGGDDDNDVESVANSAAESADEAAGEAGEAAEEAGEEAEEAGEDAGQSAEEAGEDAGESAEEAGEEAENATGEADRSVKVEIEDFAYDPDPVQVAMGGKVTWQNRDSAPHTATADDGSFDTGNLEEGKLGSQSFKKAGTYAYFCEIHPDMRGTVEVVDTE
jgi:plastocyanin